MNQRLGLFPDELKSLVHLFCIVASARVFFKHSFANSGPEEKLLSICAGRAPLAASMQSTNMHLQLRKPMMFEQPLRTTLNPKSKSYAMPCQVEDRLVKKPPCPDSGLLLVCWLCGDELM